MKWIERSSLVFVFAFALWNAWFWWHAGAPAVLADHGETPTATLPPALVPAAAAARQRADAQPEPAAPPGDALAVWAAPAGFDAVATAYPLTWTALSSLSPGSTLQLPHPEGGWVLLEVDATEDVDDMRALRLRSDGLVSTITLRGHGFMGTIATWAGVYGVMGMADESVIIDQRVLEHRSNPRVPDFAVPRRDGRMP